jgi:hypothetical protein
LHAHADERELRWADRIADPHEARAADAHLDHAALPDRHALRANRVANVGLADLGRRVLVDEQEAARVADAFVGPVRVAVAHRGDVVP